MEIDAVDRGQDRGLATGLGDVEEAVLPGQVPEVLRTEADEVERQVIAAIFRDMTDELLGDVYPDWLYMRLKAGGVLEGDAVATFLGAVVVYSAVSVAGRRYILCICTHPGSALEERGAVET